MRGVERTRTLKFDHPGLDTTATRSGSRLVIQNDIGATDAHVVVIAVEDCTVRITYTDVHLARSKFFAGLFDEFPVRVERSRSPAGRGPGRRGRVLSRHRSLRSQEHRRPRTFPRSDRCGSRFSDRLEQGAQGAAIMGVQRRRRPHSRLGGAKSDRPSRLSRARRRRARRLGRAQRRPVAHRLRRKS